MWHSAHQGNPIHDEIIAVPEANTHEEDIGGVQVVSGASFSPQTDVSPRHLHLDGPGGGPQLKDFRHSYHSDEAYMIYDKAIHNMKIHMDTDIIPETIVDKSVTHDDDCTEESFLLGLH
ncbi:hypothetical protein M8J75_011114 [Diaphorina citri]|nr:hypothetical protein M8J75_011114 [Diaphorina citri]